MSRTKGALGKKPAKCRIKPIPIKISKKARSLSNEIIGRISFSAPWLLDPMKTESKQFLHDSICKIIEKGLGE